MRCSRLFSSSFVSPFLNRTNAVGLAQRMRPWPRTINLTKLKLGYHSDPLQSQFESDARNAFLRRLEAELRKDKDLGLHIGRHLSGESRRSLADGLLHGGAASAFETIDGDKDGKISIQELHRAIFGDETGHEQKIISSRETKKAAEQGLRPKSSQLVLLAVQGAIPFVIFGFLDNFIMIVAGDQIDSHLGAAFNLSVMASAALGNTVSDFVGQTAGGAIGEAAERLGWPNPKLTEDQKKLHISKRAHQLGTIVGIVIGCLLGMLPLLFMESREDRTSRKVFKAIDRRGNGKISQEDLADAFQLIGLRDYDWVADLVMHETGGSFNLDMFRSQLRKAKGWLIMNNKTIDMSGDIDKDHMMEIVKDLFERSHEKSQKEWEALFNRVDLRGSGRISCSELLEVFYLLHFEASQLIVKKDRKDVSPRKKS